MTWKDVGKAFKIYSPMLASAVAGPLGPIAGGAISLVTSALGMDENSTPIQVLQEITKNPGKLNELKKLEENNKQEIQKMLIESGRVRMQEESKRILTVNQTMQAEAKSEHWIQWSWRPVWGLVSAASFMGVIILIGIICYQAISKDNLPALNAIPLIIGAFTTLFSIPAGILGIAAYGRNKLKEKQLTMGMDNGDNGISKFKIKDLKNLKSIIGKI